MRVQDVYQQQYDADREVNKFLHQYEAQAGLSNHKRYYKRKPIRYADWINEGSPMPFEQTLESEPMVEMYLPQDKFRRLVKREQELWDLVRGNEVYNNRLKKSIEEERIRNSNPAVLNAYKKYLTLLELARK